MSKNHLREDTIRGIAARAFPRRSVVDMAELTEGMCNAAYCITLDDGTRHVLKVATDDASSRLHYEVNIMDAEVKAMAMAQRAGLPVARVEYHDDSRTLCTGQYFIMEYMPGQSMNSLRSVLSEPERDSLLREVGALQRDMTAITGTQFGLLGDPDHRFDSLNGFVDWLIQGAMEDAARKHVLIGVEREAIAEALARDRGAFEEITRPTLVHWDMWEGNIFVKDGHVSGIIDWERAMWGEPLMDDRFRRHTRSEAFLQGFGIGRLTERQRLRIGWYDVFLYLVMMTEGAYRGYADDSQYRWVKPLFEASWAELCRRG